MEDEIFTGIGEDQRKEIKMKITSNAEAAVVYSELLVRAVCCQISPTCLTGQTVKLLNLADISVADFILFCLAGSRVFVYFVTDSCVDIKESVELMRHQGLLDCGSVRILNAGRF